MKTITQITGDIMNKESQFKQSLDRFMDVLETSKPRDGSKPRKFRKIDPLAISGLHGERGFFSDATEADLVGQLRITVAGGAEDEAITIQSIRPAHKKEMRGAVRVVRPDMKAIDLIRFDTQRGEFLDCPTQFLFETSSGWMISGPSGAKPAPPALKSSLSLAPGIQFTQETEWSVEVWLNSLFSVRLVTDPTGIKEMFSQRDKSPRLGKRASLITWVTDHWREIRSNEGDEAYVREHLRGATEFNWFGYRCRALPSVDDREREASLIERRKRLKEEGRDRR